MATTGNSRKAKPESKSEKPDSKRAAAADKGENGDRNDKGEKAKPSNASETLASAVLGLSKLYANCGEDGLPGVTDAVTQALLLILGSAPSVVALDGLQSAQVASGAMYHGAVANQQRTNLLAMTVTAKCVRHMLAPYPSDRIDETIILDENQEKQ
jgi:hypothetical protein